MPQTNPRYYLRSTAGNIVTNFPKVFDTTLIPTDGNGVALDTGAYRELRTTDLSSNVSVSGLTIGAVAVTGNLNAVGISGGSITISNPVLAVTGNFASTVNAVAITGNPGITITGGLNITNMLLSGISGALTTSLTDAAWVTGRPLSQLLDNVTVWQASSGVVSNSAVSGLAAPFFGTALPNNPNRRAWFIQNMGTGTIMVRYSSSMPTTGSLNFLLKGGVFQNDGLGASWSDSPAVYTGPVSVSGYRGAPIVYIAWEL